MAQDLSEPRALTLAVLVPTRARPDDLLRCLRALGAQSSPVDEVVVVMRPDDDLTADALRAAAAEGLLVTSVMVRRPGQVAALNEGLDHVRRSGADVVAITDDDAAPRPDWCERIVRHFSEDPALAGVGGRDWMHDQDGRVDDRSMATVGKVQWFGRVVGGHPRGVGPAREVDVLKGANMSYRLSAIRGVQFDERLRGPGAQIFNDFAFSLAVRSTGGRLVYDPAVAVDHYPAERHDDHSRVGRTVDAVAEAAFNETLMLPRFLGPIRLMAYLIWAVLVGSRLAPGLAQVARLRLQGRKDAHKLLQASVASRVQALRAAGLGRGRGGQFLRRLVGGVRAARSRLADPEGHRIIAAVRQQGLTFLEAPALADLRRCVQEIESSRVPGAIIEAGCARGGSAIVMATAKGTDRTMQVYDVFARIPPPGPDDGQDAHERFATIEAGQADGWGGRAYYGYEDDLLAQVTASFNRFGVSLSAHHVGLIEGLYEDTLHVDGPVALAHIDCDWYESVMTCLERIVPLLSPGGVLVIDDYDAWSGCRRAVDEFFAPRATEYEFIRRQRLHIVRKNGAFR